LKAFDAPGFETLLIVCTSVSADGGVSFDGVSVEVAAVAATAVGGATSIFVRSSA